MKEVEMVYSPITSDIIAQTVGEFIEEMNLNTEAPKVVADLVFQSKQRWGLEDKQKYIQSVILNMAPSKFILASTISCGVNANTVADEKYFNTWSQRGVEWLNVDSNNRVTCIKEFVEGQFTTGKYQIKINGTVHNVEDVTFEDLPYAVKNQFLNALITIEKVQIATRADLSELFIRLNDGKPLNNPEKRNAIISETSDQVRTTGEQYSDTFIEANLFTEKEIGRRKLDDYIAHLGCVYFMGKDKSITPKVMLELYDPQSQYNNEIRSFIRLFNEFMSIVGVNLGDIGYTNALLDLFILYIDFKKEGYTLEKEKYNDFIDAYRDAQAKCLADKTPIEWKSERWSTYKELLRNRGVGETNARLATITKLFDVNSFGIMKDKTRNADKATRIIAAHRDGNKTYEGEEIERGKLLTAQYEAGHKIPHSKGGKTDVDNIVMQTKENNRKTGAKELR